MSHETGIVPTEDLKLSLGKAKGGTNVRVVKMTIADEKLLLEKSVPPNGTFAQDFDMLSQHVENDVPCYLLLRTDESNSYGYVWILITYVPVTSKTREKMLYSSTKAALRREFGTNQLKTEFFSTEKSELSHKGFLVDQDRSDKPYTEQEIELAAVKEQERMAMRGLGDKVKLSSNISFPPTEYALDAIMSFKANESNFAQFTINGKDEMIECVRFDKDVAVKDIDGMIPRDQATYNMYRVPVAAGDKEFINDNPVLFLHAISNNSGVKEKMLFSSCKSTFLQLLACDEIGINIDRKVEVDINDENASADFILTEVRVKKVEVKKTFTKPKAPGRQGTGRKL